MPDGLTAGELRNLDIMAASAVTLLLMGNEGLSAGTAGFCHISLFPGLSHS